MRLILLSPDILKNLYTSIVPNIIAYKTSLTLSPSGLT